MSTTNVITEEKRTFLNRMKFFAEEGNLFEGNFFELDHLLAKISLSFAQKKTFEKGHPKAPKLFRRRFSQWHLAR